MRPALVSDCLAHIREEQEQPQWSRNTRRSDPQPTRLIPADTLKVPASPSGPAGSASPRRSLQKQPPVSRFIFKKEKKKFLLEKDVYRTGRLSVGILFPHCRFGSVLF